MIQSIGLTGGLDVRGLVSSLMQAERIPVTRLTTQKAGIETKISEYGRIMAARATAETSVQAAGSGILATSTEAEALALAKKAVEELNGLTGKIRLSTALKASLQSDSSVNSLKTGIRSAIGTALYSDDTSPVRNFVKVNAEGYLTLDEAAFKAEFATNPSGANTALGTFFRDITPELSKTSNGASRIESFTSLNQLRITQIERRIEKIETGLKTVESTLTKKFSALQDQLNYMDRALNPSQLNGVSNFSWTA